MPFTFMLQAKNIVWTHFWLQFASKFFDNFRDKILTTLKLIFYQTFRQIRIVEIDYNYFIHTKILFHACVGHF